MITSPTQNTIVRKSLGAAFCLAIVMMLAPSVRAADDTANDTASDSAPTVLAANTTSTSSTSKSTSKKSELRLELDKVHLYIQTGKTEEAEELIDQLKEKYPDNADVLAAEDELNNIGGTENAGVNTPDVCNAKNLDPAVADLMERGVFAHAPSHGNFGCAGYNRRITNEAFEQIENLTGQTSLVSDLGGYMSNTTFAFDLQNDHINTRTPFAHVNGTTQSFYGNRQQGTVTLDKMFNANDEVGASIYALEDQAGGGLQYRRWDKWGSTSIKANINKPDWDYVETIVQHGSQDNVVLERQQLITQDVTATVDGFFKRYSLDHDYNTADAPGWELGLDYEHDFDFSGGNYSNPFTTVTLGAHYNVDAEYFTRIETRSTTAGAPYNPLPATTYEDHMFTASADKTLFTKLKLGIFGGYGVNRIAGNSGPVYGGSITYNLLKNIGIDIHGSRNALGGQNESEKEDILGASLKVMW